MGLFCGKKCKCKRRCKSYFPGLPDMERACKKACSSNSALTRDDFLCSGNYVIEQEWISQLGTDPCPGNNVTVEDVFDPFNTRQFERNRFEDMKPILYGLVGLVLVALGVLVLVKTD